MKKLLLAFTLLALTILSYAQFNRQKMDSLLNSLAVNNKAMGSLAISKNGKLVYARAIGERLIEEGRKVPSNTETRYRIGSISKMFTGVMIFQLIEEKKLSFDTKLDAYFSSVPNAGKITIEQLLGHRSGIHNFTDDENYLKWNTMAKSEQEMLKIISTPGSDFEPGTKAAYSNSNFLLLGYIIEKITGKSYAYNLEKRIISKLSLKNTTVGGKTKPENNESYSYRYAGKWDKEQETDMSIPGGAGSIISTPTDLVKFIDALFTSRLVSASSLSKMKDIKDGYGLALFRFPFYDKSAYGHTGGIDGFSSILGYFPGDSLAVAYISNGQVYPVNDVLIGVLSIYFNKEYTLPDFTPSNVQVSAQDLDKLTGSYASSQLPLKITISRKELQLIAQASGQSSFPLEPTGTNKFRFEPAGLELEFFPEKNAFTLKQGGQSFQFSKEN